MLIFFLLSVRNEIKSYVSGDLQAQLPVSMLGSYVMVLYLRSAIHLPY